MKARIVIRLCTSVLMAAFAFSVLGQSPSSVFRNSQSYFKDYQTAEYSVRVGFTPYKAQMTWGEPLQITFLVQNIGTNVFGFRFGGDYRGKGRHDRFKILVTDVDGNLLPDPRTNFFLRGGILTFTQVEPGRDFTKLINLIDFRLIEKEGIYNVNCSFAFDADGISEKERTGLVAESSFQIEILERTPERVASVLDELRAKAQASHGENLSETVALIARFGQEYAIPRLSELARNGSVEMRVAALRALPLIPTDASLGVVVAGLADSDSAVRVAAASSLGEMKQDRAVDALLGALHRETSPVADAVLLALGASKSELAFSVITNALDTGTVGLQRAAINALVNYGGSNAAMVLQQHINADFLELRYDIVLALVEKMGQPMRAEWLLPVLMERGFPRGWFDSLRLLRMYGGENAIPAMLSCVDFDVAWSRRNWWILDVGVKPFPNSPPINYEYDSNSDGTLEQWQKNLLLLQKLKPLAGPIPPLIARPKYPATPYLQTDPPIEFHPTFEELETGEVRIASGFLKITLTRTGARLPYKTEESYRNAYEDSAKLRSLPGNSERCADLAITAGQLRQLNDLLLDFAVRLCGSDVTEQKTSNLYHALVSRPGYCPSSQDWSELLSAYKEAPPALREQAKADLMDSVRIFSQNYHAGTIEFTEAAKKILSPAQLAELQR